MDLHVSVALEDFERSLAAARREGFLVEVRMTDVDLARSVDDREVARLRGLIGGRGAGFTHGPFLGIDAASLNGHLARYSIESLERGLEVTAGLGGSVMVVHTNYSPFFSRAGLRAWTRNWSERMPPLLARARHLGVRVAFENVWEQTPEALARLLDELPRGEAFVCLDTGHVAAFSRMPVGRWWDALGDRVIAVHLHDNDGLSDDHMPPGSGIFDFPALVSILRGLDELPLMTLEVDVARAAAGRRHLERLFAPGAPSKGSA